jgi:hypothetical protein
VYYILYLKGLFDFDEYGGDEDEEPCILLTLVV